MRSELGCVVLCAGKGTRMKSELPKVLHPICGRPMAAFPISSAQALAAEPLLAVVGHHGEWVAEQLQSACGADIRTVVQAEQRGTGHAVQVAMAALSEDETPQAMLILYGDTPLLRTETLARLVRARQEAQAALALLTTRLPDPTGYGRILRDDAGLVTGIVEDRDASPEERAVDEVNPGIYVIDGMFLRQRLSALSTENAQGELYLTDLVAMAAAEGRVIDLPIDSAETLGVNDRRQLAVATQLMRSRVAERAMLAGVTLEDPATTYIEDTVSFGTDVVVGPQVSLKGQTQIGDGVVIGQGAILHNMEVHAGAQIHAYSVCEDARVDEDAEVGPFARLRPLAHLGAKAKVGNFVEVKKAHLGAGAKANHLAYLGDAEIGAGCNIGAGTITCNYDGVGKHRTTLGEGVFIGSNSTLVAPLQIDDHAYVAAASCVTKDVPGDALAVSRVRQENKEGYAARLRARNAARAKK